MALITLPGFVMYKGRARNFNGTMVRNTEIETATSPLQTWAAWTKQLTKLNIKLGRIGHRVILLSLISNDITTKTNYKFYRVFFFFFFKYSQSLSKSPTDIGQWLIPSRFYGEGNASPSRLTIELPVHWQINFLLTKHDFHTLNEKLMWNLYIAIQFSFP